ncbi:cytochrome C [Rhodobacteraceae bacterium R_SAG6]|nr:cytochrome C [Rhodobacteraceae bacterium R_SAG6]
MKNTLRIIAILAVLGASVGGLVVGVGLYNVSARVGHWPGVSWVLHTTFRNSVRLRASSPEEVPPLDDPDLIALGAAHYATACAFCHATPDELRSATARAMTPAPPHIEEAVSRWQPNEMHWIVKNGVKMSGMPAWPAQGRDEEVWSVVAYLQAVKTQASPPVPAAAGKEAGAEYCRSCHGTINGPVPRLDLQTAGYLSEQLRAYRDLNRPSGIMAQAVSLVPSDRFDALAREFARQGAEGSDAETSAASGRAEAASPAARLARQGTRDVPACLACHGADAPRKGSALFGQSQQYLSDQLRLWRDGINDHDPLMAAAARDLSDSDIAELSQFFAGRPP